jgi:DoxX-like protein
MSRTLWIVQCLLACVFLVAGAIKLVSPIDTLQAELPLPEALIRFIGFAETLGAIGLILPSLLRILPGLTPLAAAGLAILMIGATLLTPALSDGEIAPAVLPLVLGLLSALVVYGRTRRVPIQPRRARPMHFASR